MKITILGGAGFLGVSLAQSLQKTSYKVQVLDTEERLSKNQKYLLEVERNVSNYPDTTGIENLLHGTDILIHLAYTTSPASSMNSIIFDAKSNIISSINVFEAAKNAGVQKIIFSSSGGTVYGIPNKLPVDENHVTQPISAYGVSKLSIENYLNLYASKSVTTINLRIGNPYGPYQLLGTKVGIIANYLNAVFHDNTLEIWGDGSIVRDYIYIDDLTSAFQAACNSDLLPSGTYNIAEGNGYSINEIIEAIRTVTGKKLNIKHSPARTYDVPTIILDCNRFSTYTAWRSETSLLPGIKKMWKDLNAL